MPAGGPGRVKLLLHTCCAPCLTQSYSVLSGSDGWKNVIPRAPDFSITLHFFNPNVDPLEERARRLAEVKKFIGHPGRPAGRLDIIEDMGDPEREQALWREAVKGLENEPEKGARCRKCYRYRLERTFRRAAEEGFSVVATTLTLSPHKDILSVNEAGRELSKMTGIAYLESDFKRNAGYEKSIAYTRSLGIYRQAYCGCGFGGMMPTSRGSQDGVRRGDASG